MRVRIGGFIGAGLLIWGRRFHSKGLEIFAQGLVGAGISIFYLSVSMLPLTFTAWFPRSLLSH